MSTARPEPKRVRSDQDHSKESVQEREEKKKPRSKQGKDDKGKDGKDKDKDKEDDDMGAGDEDWLSKPPFSVGAAKDGWKTVWRQSCWCGKTAFAYNGDPLQAKICHCEDCQRLHGAPFQHAAVFKKDMVRLDSSADWLGFLSAHGEVHPLSKTPTPIPHKISCRACGSPLFDEGNNMIMAFPPTFEWPRTNKEVSEGNHKAGADSDGADGKGENSHTAGGAGHKDSSGKWKKPGLPEVFRPQCHIFYERRVVDMNDGLVKWRGHKDTEKMGDTDR